MWQVAAGWTVVTINPQRISGNWMFGIALDVHTTSSTPTGPNQSGHMQFDTVRPKIAELLFQLKYRNNQAAARGIIDAAATFLRLHRTKPDIMISVPPSSVRPIQPVLVLANGIGAAIGLPVVKCVTTTRPTMQPKSVTDREKRQELLDGLYAMDSRQTANKNILLFDDLFRSGSTLNAITDVLLRQGRAASVRVLTITKTRSNQ